MATRARKSRKEELPDSLVDSVEDGTNIGERNGAGEGSQTTEIVEAEQEPVTKPVAASEPDPEIVPAGTEPEPGPQPDSDLIRVKGKVPANRIAIAEISTRHPDGQLVIVGDAEGDAARTQRVAAAIKDGRLAVI